MQMFSSIAGIIKEGLKLFNSRPARLKDQALEAAYHYIMISESNKYKGRGINSTRKAKLLLHFKKQFMSWRDGH